MESKWKQITKDFEKIQTQLMQAKTITPEIQEAIDRWGSTFRSLAEKNIYQRRNRQKATHTRINLDLYETKTYLENLIS